MTKSISAFFAIVAIIAQTIIGQAIVPHPPMPPEPPVVRFKYPESITGQPIIVNTVDVNATITGAIAETTMTLVFTNPNTQIMEAELLFPLPTGATVSGYALDINGKLVDGVIVPKDKARIVFEEVVRQGIDPGLVEQATGNTFRTRIYPINPKGSRTIKITYVSEVDSHFENGTIFSNYLLPLRFANKLTSFKLKLNVAADIEPPVIQTGSFSNMQFKQWQTFYTAETELNNIELSEDLSIAIKPRSNTTAAIQHATDKEAFFAFNTFIPKELLQNLPADTNPKYILWDASLSRKKSDHAREFEFIKALVKPGESATLVIFRNAPEKPITVTSAQEIIDIISKTPYDGATNINGVLATLPKGVTAYLFSDGIDTYSDGTTPASDCEKLHAIFADKDQNATALKRLANAFHGVAIDLRTIETKDALALLQVPVCTVDALTVNGKTPEFECAFENGKLAVIASLNENPSGNIAITTTIGKSQKTFSLDVQKNIINIPEGKLIKTRFGQLKIARLIAENAAEKDVLAASRQFNLVTPYSSLLVLDSLAQYLRYGIRPPESLPEMRREYDKQQKQVADLDEFKLTPRNINSVLSTWSNLVAWHVKDFPREAKAFLNQAKERAEQVRAVSEGMAAPPDRAPAVRRATAPRPAPVNAAGGAVQALAAPNVNSEPAEDAEAPREPAQPQAPKATVAIKPWLSDAPYMKALEEAQNKQYEKYLELRDKFGEAPGFYMDCADFFSRQNQNHIAMRILSNLAELTPDNPKLLRILGYSLRFAKDYKQAEIILRKVIKLAPEEPQSYRDLALVLDDQEKFQEAVDFLMMLVNFQFNGRFPEIETIALTEVNRIIVRAKAKNITIKNVPEKLIHNIDVDIRVVINWDTDMSDMDLWVTDTFKEKCFYRHRFTETGGRNSCDFTQGYGPEVFMIRDAVKGDYLIETDYYGSHSQKVLGAITLYAEVFTNYARPNEQHQTLAFRLNTKKEVVKIGTISHDGTIHPRHSYAKPFQYQIKTDDTMASIVEKFYGDADGIVEKILKLNPTIKLNPNLKNNTPLPVGVIITLPEN